MELAVRAARSGRELLHFKLARPRASEGPRGVKRGAVWSLAAVAGLAAVLWYIRRGYQREKLRLFLLIQERDQKISRLLLQVAQMNEDGIFSLQNSSSKERLIGDRGFTHSAFALGYEAGINKSPIDGNLIPPGALVTIVQKGLQYIELEANLNNNDINGDDDFSLLQPWDLITKGVHELRQIIKEKKESFQKEQNKDEEKDKEPLQEKERELAYERDRESEEREKEKEKGKEKTEKDEEQEMVK